MGESFAPLIHQARLFDHRPFGPMTTSATAGLAPHVQIEAVVPPSVRPSVRPSLSVRRSTHKMEHDILPRLLVCPHARRARLPLALPLPLPLALRRRPPARAPSPPSLPHCLLQTTPTTLTAVVSVLGHRIIHLIYLRSFTAALPSSCVRPINALKLRDIRGPFGRYSMTSRKCKSCRSLPAKLAIYPTSQTRTDPFERLCSRGDLARNAPRGILLSFFPSSFVLPSPDRRG